ncbi:MAG: 5'-nucleotidase C-terminal domain-containing protein, partial [Propionicimonas sp.]|nr:5'-nucleotidase C-terminal domain-containing protein [Propionicimonas sp.]
EQTHFGDLVRGASADVDVIFSAHTHMAYNCTIGGRPVIQSGSYAANLAQVVLNVDPDTGTVASATSGIIPLTAGSVTPDPEIVDIVNQAVAAADLVGAEPVGTITADITRAKTASGSEDRGSESSLGSLVADIQLWATSESPNYGGAEPAVLAFMNPGGLRADLVYAPDGVVTYKEAALVQPFANTLVTMNLTGAQIRSVLEEQWQPTGASRPVLRLGVSADLAYTYDPSAPRGSHILSVTYKGAPLDPTATFRVVVNSFLASGGDNFTTLAQGTAKADSGQIDLQAAVEYFETHPSVSPPALGRAVPVLVPPAASEDLTDANTGPVLVEPAARAGDQLVVTVGTSLAGQAVEVWLFSDPVQLYAGAVAADGTVTVTIPAGTASGLHKLAVFTSTDALVGWGPVAVAAAGAAGVNLTPPSVVGDVHAGATVTADPGTWWPDGLTLGYQWKLDGKPIKKATGSSYRIQRGDVGHKLSVVVTATAAGLKPGSASSAGVKVAPAPLANLSLPKILGRPAYGHRVVAHPGKWSQHPLKYGFQWKRDGVAIKGATKPLYRIAKSDIGSKLTVTVTAKASGQAAVSATSKPVVVAKR